VTLVMHIDDRRYLVEREGLKGIEARVLAAVSAGGAFLDLTDGSGYPVAVLVTASSAIRLIERPDADVAVTDTWPDPAYFDIGWQPPWDFESAAE
jgi:hypothetical protein